MTSNPKTVFKCVVKDEPFRTPDKHKPWMRSCYATRISLDYEIGKVTEAIEGTMVFVFKHPGDAHIFSISSMKDLAVLECEWGDKIVPLPIRASIQSDEENSRAFWKAYLKLINEILPEMIEDVSYFELSSLFRKTTDIYGTSTPVGTYGVDWVKPIRQHPLSDLPEEQVKVLKPNPYRFPRSHLSADWRSISREKGWAPEVMDEIHKYVRSKKS